MPAQGLAVKSPITRSSTIVKGGGVGATSVHPFRVEQAGEGEAQIPATTASYLHKSYLAADSLAVTALFDAFDLEADTHAWIEILVDENLAPTAAELKTGSEFPALIVTAGGPPAIQTQYNLPVGRVVADAQPGMPGFDFVIGDDPPVAYHWQQLLRDHQLLKVVCSGSNGPCLVSGPWQGV